MVFVIEKVLSLNAGSSPAGGLVVPGPPVLKSLPPHFTFGPSVAAYFQHCILKMCPLLVLATPPGFWPPLLLNPGDGPDSTGAVVTGLGAYWLNECLTGTFWMTDRDKVFKPGLSWLKRDVAYSMVCLAISSLAYHGNCFISFLITRWARLTNCSTTWSHHCHFSCWISFL